MGDSGQGRRTCHDGSLVERQSVPSGQGASFYYCGQKVFVLFHLYDPLALTKSLLSALLSLSLYIYIYIYILKEGMNAGQNRSGSDQTQ